MPRIRPDGEHRERNQNRTMLWSDTCVEYDANLMTWLWARDVLAGEDAVKAATDKYLPKLECQSDEEYAAYLARAAFFNATARTADGFLGLVFRRAPFVKIPGDGKAGTNATNATNEGKRPGGNGSSALGKAMAAFVNDADMLGTSLANHLEYTGWGLTTFERAMERDERLMAILGARRLETQKRVVPVVKECSGSEEAKLINRP